MADAETSCSLRQELCKGLIRENPTLVGLLGMCPTLAVTQEAKNALGMGIATTLVLIGSNVVISLLRRVIPQAVKLPCYIVIIAGFVTMVEFLLHGFVPELYTALGTFLSLITVNCIILGRAELFACKHTVIRSALDGAGMGLGFTLALLLVGSVRELFGAGTLFGISVMEQNAVSVLTLAPGGFFVLGCVIALVNRIAHREPPRTAGCTGCPNAATCAASKGGCSQ
ncbi:MAG: electron transport complex subunit E [Oscillospiraceae bacterium]|nr:electron transport complex subunit E [Oscillospiraceae bacterium]